MLLSVCCDHKNGWEMKSISNIFSAAGVGRCLVCALVLSFAALACGQQRPPAVPLIAHNPYFSVWSMADKLTDQNTKHWTGREQPILGWHGSMARRGGSWAQMPREIPAMTQTSLAVTPTHTTYEFQAGQVSLTVSFFTPAFPRDLDVLSRPVTYLTVSATGQGEHELSVLIDVDPVIAVNTSDEAVTWGRSRAQGLTVLNVGSRDQNVLNRPGDDLRIDWGYFHLAAPDEAGASLRYQMTTCAAFNDGRIAGGRRYGHAAHAARRAAELGVLLPFGKVGSAPVSRHVLLAYTEEFAIEYLGRRLRPYWQRNGLSVQQMLADAENQHRRWSSGACGSTKS